MPDASINPILVIRESSQMRHDRIGGPSRGVEVLCSLRHSILFCLMLSSLRFWMTERPCLKLFWLPGGPDLPFPESRHDSTFVTSRSLSKQLQSQKKRFVFSCPCKGTENCKSSAPVVSNARGMHPSAGNVPRWSAIVGLEIGVLSLDALNYLA